MWTRIIGVGVAVSGLWILCLNVKAQSAPIVLEAATVRQNMERSATVRLDVSGSAMTIRAYPLLGLLLGAYHLEPYQIIGGPEWMMTDRFDVNALVAVADDKTITPSDVSEVLKQLLAERFALKAHASKRKLPVFSLTVSKKGLLIPSAADAVSARDMRSARRVQELKVSNGTIPELVDQLSNSGLDRPVVDGTNLTGRYTYQLSWSSEESGATGQFDALAPPSIFTALKEQLGLELRPATAEVDVLIIDSVQRPSPN
jgi:uncharacterized protein (TIGR03435 family)